MNEADLDSFGLRPRLRQQKQPAPKHAGQDEIVVSFRQRSTDGDAWTTGIT